MLLEFQIQETATIQKREKKSIFYRKRICTAIYKTFNDF